jgi:hypothetical protein
LSTRRRWAIVDALKLKLDFPRLTAGRSTSFERALKAERSE